MPRSLYFSKALFEGLIFGGAFIRRDLSTAGNCVSKSIGLALQIEGNLPFLLCFTWFRAISKYKPPPGGAFIWRGDLTEGFLRYEFGWLLFGGAYIYGGAYFWNFTVATS